MAAGIFQIVIGIAGIVLGFLADAFYPAFMRHLGPEEEPMPKWLGRVIFVVVGIVFIVAGISDLRHH